MLCNNFGVNTDKNERIFRKIFRNSILYVIDLKMVLYKILGQTYQRCSDCDSHAVVSMNDLLHLKLRTFEKFIMIELSSAYEN